LCDSCLEKQEEKNKQPNLGLADQFGMTGSLHPSPRFVNLFRDVASGVKAPEHLYRCSPIAYTVAAVRGDRLADGFFPHSKPEEGSEKI
jgi:hypothetical protein